jgi:hypothetical protein
MLHEELLAGRGVTEAEPSSLSAPPERKGSRSPALNPFRAGFACRLLAMHSDCALTEVVLQARCLVVHSGRRGRAARPTKRPVQRA